MYDSYTMFRCISTTYAILQPVCIFMMLVLIIDKAYTSEGPRENAPKSIVPPECGPPYHGKSHKAWVNLLYSTTVEFINEGAKRFPNHPVTATRASQSYFDFGPFIFWGVIKCYSQSPAMQTVSECVICLNGIRDMLLFFSCGDPFYTPRSGAYQSALCYFRYTTLEIIPEGSCPYIPDPYEQN